MFQKIRTDVAELESKGELGHGTCGQVVRMLHKPTNMMMAVKVLLWVCACVCACMRVCVCVCVYLCMYAHVCLYACLCVCVHMCVCVCV